MRVILLILMLFPLMSPVKVQAMVDPATSAAVSTANLDLLLERAMAENLIAGGVVVVGNHEGILATAARGQLSAAPGAPAITDRTLFDVASLTKVIATTPAVIKLLDEGRISLTDTLSRWFPELAGSDKGNITVLHLLTHTSGLSDVMVGQDRSVEGLVRKVAAQRFRGAGSGFEYADINFILLGELVHRVSGERLDKFCREEIYEPLGTRDTSFLPSRDGADIAPTSGTQGGVVQDENARRLGGVAGHAGLFSSAYDLARYARLILGRGTLDGTRILSDNAITQMTTPYACNNGRIKRALGWDMASPFSAPKGTYFSDASFGHTGYSGSSIWIDPQQDMFVIMLTRRMDYRNVHNFNQLRRNVSTYAAADVKGVAGELAPVAEVEKIRAQVIEASAALINPPRRGRIASLKWREERRAAKCSVKPGRRVLQARAGHRGAKVSKVARNDAGKVRATAKKHRSLAKS
ncbi:serine hydrolase domain-containing protein [Geomonas subterranea]|uniref:Beta-lactamase family protein n=1 Tax=Geomonas subterranea TaxID=2847989 RepID=A0ABX8LMM9_9BACT|nr:MULTISPECIES: serine hydrolase domain-containing protein [Geomonas]QXE92176.1 beta-lactamase family protein [Geomonas subterranea]QXM09725.1 beta-lactamase family protein [Geomonas subterranea]